MRPVAADGAGILAGVLRIAGLLVIALNPGVPSLGYALLWLGIMAVARGVALFASRPVVAMDLTLLVVCVVGMEIGGLIVVPSVLAFTLADALRA
jgi:tetrahydromethanopterin S-methyltransferase subunit C